MSKWNPDEHLPECGVTAYPICICDRLRACEQRVCTRDDDHAYVAAQAEAKGRIRGYAAGLDAARDAVAGMVIETVGNSAATVDQALAAIDALRPNS